MRRSRKRGPKVLQLDAIGKVHCMSTLRIAMTLGPAPPGIVDQYEKDQKLPPDERYLWHLRMEQDIRLVVTMIPTLAALIHDSLALHADYTFKRVHGNLNECEFVIWNRATNERKYIHYCDVHLTYGSRNYLQV
jgi:hypothetical protein